MDKHSQQSKAERLEAVRTLAASNVAPDIIVMRGRELELTSEEIGKMYRAGRTELASKEITTNGGSL